MRRLVVLLCLLVVGAGIASVTASTEPAAIVSSPPQLHVTRLGADLTSDRVRLSAAWDGPGAPAVYFDRDHDQVVMDFADVDADAVTAPTAPGDDLVASWHVERPHFRRARWVVTLRHPVPPANVDVQQAAGQVTVELKRNWDFVDLYKLTPGVKWYRREYKTEQTSLLVNELHINLKDKAVRFDIGLAHDDSKSAEPTSAQVGRRGAIAGINGGFFQSNLGPLGLVVQNGALVTPPVGSRPPRTALGLTADRKVVMDQVKVENGKLVGLNGSDWSNVVMALGGGPRLVKDGRLDNTEREEALDSTGNDITYRTSRTAIAVMPDDRLILTTVTGVTNGQRGGLLLNELAQYFVSIKARDAMCLDGGGSTAMAIEGTLVSNFPRVQTERAVSDTLLVYEKAPILAPTRLHLSVDKTATLADGKTQIDAEARVTAADGKDVPDGTQVFFDTSLGVPPGRIKTKQGIAKVALVVPPTPGTLTVTAACGFAQDRAYVKLCEGLPAHLYLRAGLMGGPVIVPSPEVSPTPYPIRPTPGPPDSPSPLPTNIDPADMPTPTGAPLLMAQATDTPTATPSATPSSDGVRYLVDALVTDAAGNPLRGELLQAVTPDENVSRTTDASGTISLIVRVPAGGATVRVTHASLGACSLALSASPTAQNR